MDPIVIVQTVLLFLVLIAAVSIPIFVYERLLKKLRSEISQLTKRMDQNLGASIKLLEVRDYYQQTSAALKKLLDEAYKDGNRFRQDEIKKLLERLDTLKVRALDKTISILGAEKAQSSKRRRRSRRPRTRRPSDQNRSNRGQKPQGGNSGKNP